MKNKTQVFTVFLLLTFSTISFSQKISLGIRGGLNITDLTMDAPPYYVNGGPNIDSKESRTSFNAGIYGEYSLNEEMALQAELFYSGEGVSFTNSGTEMPADLKFGFLSLPMFFKYRIVKDFYAMTGPQLSYLLSASCTYKNGTNVNTYDIANEHNEITFGLVPAIGYDWKKFSFNVRYQIGLSKLPSSDSNWNYARYVDGNVKSNIFSVVVAYKIFEIGK